MLRLKKKETVKQLANSTMVAEGVKIFIGSEHKLFEKSGYSAVVSPYENEAKQVIGLIGVIGPTHMNYRRIIPMVNYSSKLISKILGK